MKSASGTININRQIVEVSNDIKCCIKTNYQIFAEDTRFNNDGVHCWRIGRGSAKTHHLEMKKLTSLQLISANTQQANRAM